MSETPKNPRPSSGRPQPPRPVGNPNAPRRVAARRLQEEQRQRIVWLVTGAAIALALLSVIIGLLITQVWQPSQAVARVGSASLSRRDYWAERKNAYAREIVQNFQLVALFGANTQFTQQFQGRSATIDNQIEAIRSAPVDDTVIDQWVTRQVKEQGAASLGITVNQDEVNQAMVGDLGLIFLPPPIPPVTSTATAEPTTDPAATATVTPTATLTPTPGGPTATPLPTATPAPTETPEPTPAPAEAATQSDQIIDEIYRRYQLELAAVGEDPDLTEEDFRAALNDQYREQVINTKVQEHLVPAEGFEYSDEPERVSARQVLVAVTPPADATQEQIDAAFEEARAEAEAIAAELRGGADFAAVAAGQSDDPGSKDIGGDLGSFDVTGSASNGSIYPPELVEAAFALEPNTISDPIRTQFGWHIIEVTSRDVPSEEDQLREARTEALDAWVAEQRATIGVQRFPEPTATATSLPQLPVPSATPVYAPGPPTAVPTETPAPTLTPEAPAEGTPTPTATGTP